jgi:hypothetical protein
LIYDSSDYGRAIVTEGHPDIPGPDHRLAAYEARVENNGRPDVWATSKIVTLPDGVPAAVGTSQFYAATIEWVDRNAQFVVIGRTLTGDQAISIASRL